MKTLASTLLLCASTLAFASGSVDYTCQYTDTGIMLAILNPVDKVLERSKTDDAANKWKACSVGEASALTFQGDQPRELTVKESDCLPKVFKVSFTPSQAVSISSELSHDSAPFRRWNVNGNKRASDVFSPEHGKGTQVTVPASRYEVMWLGFCEGTTFTFKPL